MILNTASKHCKTAPLKNEGRGFDKGFERPDGSHLTGEPSPCQIHPLSDGCISLCNML